MVRLAFYKAFQPRAEWYDNTIAVCTVGGHSHVELIFSDGHSFSVSPRDGGARFKNIHFHEDSWDFKDIDLTAEQEECLRTDALTYTGQPYDYLGAIFSATPICAQFSDKVFCSEVVVNLLNKTQQYSFLTDGCRYSPSKLYKSI